MRLFVLKRKEYNVRILLTGATGHLGAYLLREVVHQRLPIAAWSGSTPCSAWSVPVTPVDLTDEQATAACFQVWQPDVVIHAAALSAIADCHRNPERAYALNVDATLRLVQWATRVGSRLLYVSTDLVFDGQKGNYTEADHPNPLSHYARTKLQAEPLVLAYAKGVVVRVSWLLGPKLLGGVRFFDQLHQQLRHGQPMGLFFDEWRSPLGLPQAARCLLKLAMQPELTGLWHLGGPERLSRYEMGVRLAQWLGVDKALIRAEKREQHPAPEPRPADVSLDSSRFRKTFPDIPWPDYEASLAELFSLADRPS